jgi:hypothetical protein
LDDAQCPAWQPVSQSQYNGSMTAGAAPRTPAAWPACAQVRHRKYLPHRVAAAAAAASRPHCSILQCPACPFAALAGTNAPAYEAGAAFLRELGMDQSAEIARVLDIAMNPNSLFVSFRDKKRAVNANVRLRRSE